MGGQTTCVHVCPQVHFACVGAPVPSTAYDYFYSLQLMTFHQV